MGKVFNQNPDNREKKNKLHAKYSKDSLHRIVQHMGLIGLEILRNHAEYIKECDIAEDQWDQENPSEKVMVARLALSRMNMINYLLYPSFEFLQDSFPESKELIDLCDFNYKKAVESKIFPEVCTCQGCMG